MSSRYDRRRDSSVRQRISRKNYEKAPAPSERERTELFAQRYISELPGRERR